MPPRNDDAMSAGESRADRTGESLTTTLFHCSDLHFGHPAVPEQYEGIEAIIADRHYDVVAISGDVVVVSSSTEASDATDWTLVIGMVGSQGPLTLRELCGGTDIEKTYASRLVAKLAALGLIKKSPDPADQRPEGTVHRQRAARQS